MARLVPSQVVDVLGKLFPHVHAPGVKPHYYVNHAGYLRAAVNLIEEIPQELLALSAERYAILVRHVGAIEYQLDYWLHRGGSGSESFLAKEDPIASIRKILADCPDEYPPASTHDLSFIADQNLRKHIRADIGAAERALMNAEWKAATVLAGAAIEALLFWKLDESPPSATSLDSAVTSAISKNALSKKPNSNREKWVLEEFVVIAHELKILTSETLKAADLAREYRNLIHPGRAARLAQVCDRATALSALAGLEHVVRDLTI